MGIYLNQDGNSVEIPMGETVVGRSLNCRLRFNDPSISREHVLIRVSGTRVTVEDLGSRNGTIVNGIKIARRTEIHHGDNIQIGERRIEVLIVESDFFPDSSTITQITETPPERPPDSRLCCPDCGQLVASDDSLCRRCGFAWGDFRPGAVTQKIALQSTPDRRRHPRHHVELPVLYSSENLSIETMALNLSISGVFIRTQILDERGTYCDLTFMPDGSPAVTFQGEVMRVVEARSDAAAALGLGVQFRELGEPQRRWLDDTIERLVRGS
jgi:pSer/pThr/pTyr-binding forkhead associated (FHA) protein